MKRSFIIGSVILLTLLIGSALLVSDTAEPKTTVPDPVVEEVWPYPEPLGLTFLDEYPELTFTCPTTRVAESVQEARSQISAAANEANIRADRLRTRTLPHEMIRGREDTNAVAITIDTGTGGGYGTTELLDIAAHYNIDLTFFVTGCWALENPELMRRIVADGHSIGQHTLTHLNLSGATQDTIARELDEASRIIEETIGVRVALFRKPQYAGGEEVVIAAGERGMISAQGWPDLGDTTGWRSTTDVEDVLSRVRTFTAPGAIWVMHNISLTDLNAFEDIVRFHLEEGYDLVRIEELIQ